MSCERERAEESTVLILGGTGHLGGKAVQYMIDRGSKVWVLGQESSDVTALEAKGVSVVVGDMTAEQSLVDALERVRPTAVISTVATFPFGSPNDSDFYKP
jgi:uncharacterized protein YbjT (DUF2867 family)